MEPPNKKTRSNDELTMSRDLPDLSTLPDIVLIHILSFMEPKEAVQTCILSKRWRNLWTCVPSLNFDKSGFEGTHAAFVHFVSNMLLFRGASKLDTFRLRWHACEKVSTHGQEICQIHVSNASSWIFSALRCKPLTISLDLYGFAHLQLPHALFTCTSLEHLELQFFDLRRAATEPNYVNLPNLKKLKLRCFTLDDPVMQMILSGCPLLEELSLDSCSLNFSCMKSDMLRCLTIINCRGSILVEFFLPSLVSLSLKNEYPGQTKLSLKNTPSLLKDLLEKTVPNCSIFGNLKQLTFGQWSINEKLDLLCQLLQHTPNLEKLNIVHKKDITYVPKKHMRSGEPKEKSATGQIPFRCEHLKTIEIRYSDPSGAHELVGILLQNISQGERVRIDLSRF
ncbi:hypothetical protein LUZ61_006613 [Rhynchospora tenuis]|uniref:F-box domain-containing protein n=1 Tax=Rhynchospora tenuis TaxID=198213 RepID=A0AAD5ZRY4_9POAL|nr:hypothetical protein LUZ61_006613 [Rhynchospora tenuis]